MIDDDMIITQRGNNCQMSVMVCDRRWLKSIESAKDCWNQVKTDGIRWRLLWSCQDQLMIDEDWGDLAGISRKSTRIAVISPGSGRDQPVSRRDQSRIEVILPGSGEDRRGLVCVLYIFCGSCGLHLTGLACYICRELSHWGLATGALFLVMASCFVGRRHLGVICSGRSGIECSWTKVNKVAILTLSVCLIRSLTPLFWCFHFCFSICLSVIRSKRTSSEVKQEKWCKVRHAWLKIAVFTEILLTAPSSTFLRSFLILILPHISSDSSYYLTFFRIPRIPRIPRWRLPYL